MNRLQMLCRRALCVPIRIYQYTLSPWIGRSCRFSPSCSNYTMQAILTHGCVKGILLGAWRIARCNPLGRWGYDPVPPPGRWQSPARNLQPAKLFCTRHKRKVEKERFPAQSVVACLKFNAFCKIHRRRVCTLLRAQKSTRKAPATFEAREARTRGYSPLVTPKQLGSIQKIQVATLKDFLCSADLNIPRL